MLALRGPRNTVNWYSFSSSVPLSLQFNNIYTRDIYYVSLHIPFVWDTYISPYVKNFHIFLNSVILELPLKFWRRIFF